MELSNIQSSFSFLIIILSLIQVQSSIKANEYDICKQPVQCGNVNITYPFYDGVVRPEQCGYPGFELMCNIDNQMAEISFVTTTLQIFYLLQIDSDSQTISVAPKDYYNGYCPQNLYNTTLNFYQFDYTPTAENITLYYECPSNTSQSQIPNQFSCSNISNDRPSGYFMTRSMQSVTNYFAIPPGLCQNSIVVPVNRSAADSVRDINSLQAAFHNGFDLNWIADNGLCHDCRRIGGECGFETEFRRFACYCPDELHDLMCYNKGPHKHKFSITLITIASSVVGSAIIAITLFCLKRKIGLQNLLSLSKKERRNRKDVEAVLKRYGKLATRRYTYGDIKKITSHFKEKLGEGGYGGVYKGELQNGSPVAVKLLKNTDGDGAEFTNEVASISETNHVNVVSLVGYCFQGRKRALVYEFMPNGSLDKYIYSETIQNPLSWETLHQIAIGIGRGLEYLHQGCRTRILHFDIKPHNILLDAKFCPKVSDFGLSKPWLQTKSLMTMSGTRGTPGYIAPEVFCRGYGGASHKSDVYSYGMLVLDLVGCRKYNFTGSKKTSSELYFPHWIYKEFELKEDHELLGISNDEEKMLQRKMVIVSLWCIQMNPSNRPSISRAVEMLEEDLESLQIPPMPTPSSPPKTYPVISNTIST